MALMHHYKLGIDLGQVLILNHVVSTLGNEGGAPHYMQGHYRRGLGIKLVKLH